MTKRKKRAGAAQDPAQRSTEKAKKIKRTDVKKEQATPVMSLRCVQCRGNIADSRAGSKLSFFEDGNSLHLVMATGKEARIATCFKVKDVPPEKMPNEENPYASVSHVLCANKKDKAKEDSGTCNKKVGAVKCCPPFSANRLIFFQHKALLTNGSRISNWKSAREQGLEKLQLIPPSKEDGKRQFKPQTRPPLIRSVEGIEASARGDVLITTRPRSYQAEVFQSVVEGSRNSLVYLPSGLGKTLVAAMVLKMLMDLNIERQAYFVVENGAEAMQQAQELQKELRCTVEVMVGSSLGFETLGGEDSGKSGDGSSSGGACNLRCQQKLLDLREARLVVATAGALEHAMCKRYIDPDSICCVVLLLQETYRRNKVCARDNPLDRLSYAFFLPRVRAVNPPACEAPSVSELPKLVALMPSPPQVASSSLTPTEAVTVAETVTMVEEVLDKFKADLAAPVKTLQEVKDRTAGVELEVVNVMATPEETLLLRCLAKLVLRRIIKVAPDTDSAVEAKKLLHRYNDKGDGSEMAPPQDGVWMFPGQSYVGLCQQALKASSRRRAETEIKAAEGGGGAEMGGGELLPSRGDDRKTEDEYHLIDLMNLAYAVDEIGGERTLRKLLNMLEQEMEDAAEQQEERVEKEGHIGNGRVKGRKRHAAREGAGVIEADDPDRDDAIHIVRSYLPPDDGSDGDVDVDGFEEATEAGAGGGGGRAGGVVGSKINGALGSKLGTIAKLLVEHEGRCDRSRGRFSALLLVSTRDLARTTPETLELVPSLQPFLRAEHALGSSETISLMRRASLDRFGTDLSQANLIVSTTACSEGLEVPDCGLVVCASGTALVELRGRLNFGENCRLVGLSRRCEEALGERVRTLCQRESTMLGAIETIFGDVSATAVSAASVTSTHVAPSERPTSLPRTNPTPMGSPGTAAGTADHLGGGGFIGNSPGGSGSDGDGDGGGGGVALVKIPTSGITAKVAVQEAVQAPKSASEPASASSSVQSSTSGSVAVAAAAATSVTPTENPADAAAARAIVKPPRAAAMIVPDKPPSETSNGNGDGEGDGAEKGGTQKGGAAVAAADSGGGTKGWKKSLPEPLGAEAKKYAATYLATCLRQTLQKQPDERARSSINTTAQLAHAIKPVFEYDERRLSLSGQQAQDAFEARCFVWSRLEELNGLIVVKEAKGVSIKAARERAAQKIMQYLKEETPPSSHVSPSSSRKPDAVKP